MLAVLALLWISACAAVAQDPCRGIRVCLFGERRKTEQAEQAWQTASAVTHILPPGHRRQQITKGASNLINECGAAQALQQWLGSAGGTQLSGPAPCSWTHTVVTNATSSPCERCAGIQGATVVEFQCAFADSACVLRTIAAYQVF